MNGAFSKFSSTGSPLSPSGFTSGPAETGGLAIDGFGNLWAPSANSIKKYDSSGNVLLSVTQTNTLEGLSIDGSENIWLAELLPRQTGGAVVKLANTGSVIFTNNYTTGGPLFAWGIANDNAGNAWVTSNNSFSPSLFEVTPTGTLLPSSNGYTDGGIYTPISVAVDGAGNTWTSSNPASNNNTVIERSNTGVLLSGSNSGFTLPGVSSMPVGVAVDGSGNVWVASGGSIVFELLGAATPTVTPLSVGVKNNTLGTRP